MNQVNTFIIAALPSLAAILIFVAVCVLLWKRGRKDLVKRMIYGLVCRAEQLYGSKTGQEKKAEVWTLIYSQLPFIVRLAFPKEKLDEYIEENVKLLKEKLERGEINLLTYNQEADLAVKCGTTAPKEGGLDDKTTTE